MTTKKRKKKAGGPQPKVGMSVYFRRDAKELIDGFAWDEQVNPSRFVEEIVLEALRRRQRGENPAQLRIPRVRK